MCLQVSTTIISSSSNHLELRLCQSIALSVSPICEAEIKLAIHQDVTTGIEHLSIYLNHITCIQFIGSKVFLAIEINKMKTIVNRLVGVSHIISIVSSGFLLCDGVKNHPAPRGILHLNLHQLIIFTIGIMPSETHLSICQRSLELRRTILARRRWLKVILAVVSHRGIHRRVVLAGGC